MNKGIRKDLVHANYHIHKECPFPQSRHLAGSLVGSALLYQLRHIVRVFS